MTGMTTTVGKFLQKIRTERGITLEQVAQSTRVKLAYLQAIEHDEPSELPSVVQARGFLRLYASYLDLPAQPLLDGWQSGHFIAPETTEPHPEYPAPSDTGTKIQTSLEGEPPALENFTLEVEPEGEAEEVSREIPGVEKPTGSRQIFTEIGRQLRDRRQELSLSIADVERFTRLRGYYIETLEDGRIEDLPSLVQGRGMLSNYAEFLDLDTENLLLQFADALQARRIELTTSSSTFATQGETGLSSRKKSRQASSWRRFLTLDMVLGGSLFILLIGFVLWGAARVTNLQREGEVPTPPSISEILMTPANGLPSPTVEITPTIASGEAAGNPLPGAGGLEGNANPTAIDIPTLNSAPISVYIIASQRAWMQVTVDTSVVFDGRVAPGIAYPFTGRERIDLITGNGAALSVIYNQNELGTLGTMGEVVAISFTRDGTLVPTTAFTPTPTATPQPTATRQPTLPQITPSVTPLVP